MKYKCGCGEYAKNKFTWKISGGSVTAYLCDVCSREFWSKYKNTQAGHASIISALEEESKNE